MLRIGSTIVLVAGSLWLFSQVIRAHYFPHLRKPGDAANRVMTLGTLFVLFGSVYPQYDAPYNLFTGTGFLVVMGSAVALWVQRRRGRPSAATCPLCRDALDPRPTACPRCCNAMRPTNADGLPFGQSPPLPDQPPVRIPERR